MKWVKIASITLGALLIALLFIAFYGIPARALIASLAREAAAKSDLDLDIAGPARLTLLPTVALVVENVSLRKANSSQDLFKADRVRVGISLGSLITGRIRLTDVALKRPVMRFDQNIAGGDLRARKDGAQADDKSPRVLPAKNPLPVESITAEDCTIIESDGRETKETHIASIRLHASWPSPNDRLNLKMDAQIEGRTVRLELNADAPARLSEGKPVPIEVKLEVEGVLQTPVRITANVLTTGPVLKIDGLNGTFAQGRINGSISISFASEKPFVDANIESDLLDLTTVADRSSTGQGASAPAGETGRNPPSDRSQPSQGQLWSDAPISFFDLRRLEADVKISAREVRVNKVRIAPASLEVTLLQDVLSVNLSSPTAYGGETNGELSVDASKDVASFALRVNFAGLNALPFLTDAADFQKLEGRARGNLNLKATGVSPLRVVSSLEGTAEFVFEDGAVRDLNIPQMVRSVVDAVLSGWQEKESEQTQFSTFGVSFRVENGRARTEDLRLVGPFVRMTGSGTVDLPAQTLDFRTEPKLVATREGQGGRAGADTWGIGVPVLIQGTWSQPRIYADLPNILANPEDVLRKFKDTFGGAGGAPNSQLGGSVGKFMEGLTQGLDRPRTDKKTDPKVDGLGIADEILKRLQGTTRKDFFGR